jgi:hypothetical protein
MYSGYRPKLSTIIKIDERHEKMKNMRHLIQDRKSVSFFDKWIFSSIGIILFYRIVGVATAAGAEAKADTPGALSKNFFDNS